MKAHLYELRCLTNLHAGSGDENYSIIDNEVERDPVTNIPVIFSSGVKGAIREFLEQEMDKLNTVLKECLGSSEMEVEIKRGGKIEKEKVKSVPGKYKFLNATLIARPLRISSGDGAYILTGAADLLRDHIELLKDLDIQLQGMEEGIPALQSKIITSENQIKIEGMDTLQVDSNLMKTLIGEKWALTDSKTLEEFSLPVQARNVLDENGISKNLWYEEVVPHKSIFHLILITPDENNELDSYINEKIIQFGADASIGYGLCKVKRLTTLG